MPLPRLRPLDVSPIEHEGRTMVRLRDPSGLSDKMLVVSPAVWLVAACFDGKNELADVQTQLERELGVGTISAADVERVVQALDEALLLDSPRFAERFRAAKDEYARLPSRPAALAGLGYPAEPKKLAGLLDGWLELAGKDGASPPGELIGLVSPHIDFTRGGPLYGWSYREILTHGLADLYVILGVAHAGLPEPFTLSMKDYETPFGNVEVERDLAESLRRRFPAVAEHELGHRGEHSIEFQAVWLAHAARRLKRSFKTLPVLCSWLGDEPAASHEVLAGLEELLRGYKGKVCLLAGVDLAHVGPRFGDAESVPELIPWMEAEDKKSLERIVAVDAPGFYASAMADGGKRKVCGLSALYAFLRLMKRLHPKTKGRLLRYDHAADPAGGEVSFASLSFVR